MALMQKARLLQGKQPAFKKPDVGGFVPPETRDAVNRVVAAGMKLVYAPEAREKLMDEINRDTPVPQKLAEAVTGLMLLLDQKSNGGIPMAAIFPAAMTLLGEAAEILQTAGQAVTQTDYNEAAQMMFVLIGKKLGASDEQLMGAAEQATRGGEEEAGAPEEEQEEQPAEGF